MTHDLQAAPEHHHLLSGPDVRRVIPLALALTMTWAVMGCTTARQELRLPPTTPELEQRDLPVTPEDLQILSKAAALLANESVWNRADDRVCDDDEATGKRSLFCALQRACIDVLGGYDHRRVALQEVRFAVEDATRGRDFDHRLMEFNNLPETQLVDVRRVLEVATERVRSRLERQGR